MGTHDNRLRHTDVVLQDNNHNPAFANAIANDQFPCLSSCKDRVETRRRPGRRPGSARTL